MIDRIKNALTRKYGPLPAWAWLLIFGIGVYIYRKRQGAVSGTGTGSVAPVPPDPQAGQVLQPGESYYDPNTGQLVTAPNPGGSSTGDTGSPGTTSNPIDTSNGATGNNKAAWNRWFRRQWLRRHPKAWRMLWLRKHPGARKRGNAVIRTHTGGRLRRQTSGGASIHRARDVQPTANQVKPRSQPKTGATRRVVRQRPVAAMRGSSATREASVAPRSTRRTARRETRRRRRR